MGLLNLDRINRALDAQGQPVPAARRYVYLAGGEVLAPLFEDPNLTRTVSNPMVADENGLFGFCHMIDGEYRVRVETSDGHVLDDIDSLVVSSHDSTQATNVFNTFADLLADSTLSVEIGHGKLRVAPGQMVEVLDRNVAFCVTDPGSEDYHFRTSGGLKLRATRGEAEIEVDRTLTFSDLGDSLCDGMILRQVDNANLPVVCSVAAPNSMNKRRSNVDIHVDGNRDNNLPGIGIDVSYLKKHSNAARLAASECDTGIRIRHQVEYANFFVNADSCRTGIQVVSQDSVTPDELVLTVCAHMCETFFVAEGANKMSGKVTFGCEQSTGTAAIFRQGWWEVSGIVRGCATTSPGVGLLIEQDPSSSVKPFVAGTLRIAGGSDTNCTWAADIQAGTLENLQLNCIASYASGVRIGGGVDGAACIALQTAPASGVGLELGDEAQLNGFRLLAGSRISGGVNVTNCVSCVLEFSHLVGTITIGSGSFDNTLYIPRRQGEIVTFVNNRTQQDNKIIFRGAYTLAEMNDLNGGAPFKGMEVEQCQNFDGARAYFDGDAWVPSHGVLATGTVTIANGSTQGLAAHTLPSDPGNDALSMFPEGDWGNATSWWGNVTSSYVVAKVDTDPGADVTFRWVLRKT